MRERSEERRHDDVPFGRHGSAWSTIVDVRLRVLPTSGSWVWVLPGLGADYLDLDIELLVMSPTVVRVPPWFISQRHGLRCLTLDEWSMDGARAFVHGIVDPIGPTTGEALCEVLAQHFWIDDPSEDEWLDEPQDPEDDR